MSNVTPLHAQVNGSPVTIEAVVKWVKDQATKGDMGASVARIRETGLRQMAAQVAPDEPGDALSVLNNIDRLRDRWATKNADAQGDTAKTYASRAKTSIEEYFRWAAAPSDYDPKRSAPRAERKPAAKAALASEIVPPAQHHAPSPQPSNTQTGELRNCPLGQGREPFRYILPKDGLLVRDAMRIAFHLITTCDDYDPTMSPMQVVTTALAPSQ
jgi:hypothetical protein